MARKQVSNVATERAYGGTGYEEAAPAAPPQPSVVDRLKAGATKLFTGLVPAESDEHYKAQGEKAFYEGKIARNRPRLNSSGSKVSPSTKRDRR